MLFAFLYFSALIFVSEKTVNTYRYSPNKEIILTCSIQLSSKYQREEIERNECNAYRMIRYMQGKINIL